MKRRRARTKDDELINDAGRIRYDRQPSRGQLSLAHKVAERLPLLDGFVCCELTLYLSTAVVVPDAGTLESPCCSWYGRTKRSRKSLANVLQHAKMTIIHWS